MNQLKSYCKPLVWTASGLERVWRDSECRPDSADYDMYAAKGEYEALQVVIKAPEGGLTNVGFSITSLTGNDGAIIPESNITLYREHYFYISRPSHQRGNKVAVGGKGWYPDALIPFFDPETGKPPLEAQFKAVPFDLDKGLNQPIWIDIFVPRNAAKGLYKAEYTVTSDQGSVKGEIRLTVWNFELPLKPSLKSSFNVWNQQTKGAVEEVFKHRLMCERWKISPEEKGKFASCERRLIDTYGASCTGLGFWSKADIFNGTMPPPPPVKEIKALASLHQPDIQLYNYTADEVGK